jgi:hypothetical protein
MLCGTLTRNPSGVCDDCAENTDARFLKGLSHNRRLPARASRSSAQHGGTQDEEYGEGKRLADGEIRMAALLVEVKLRRRDGLQSVKKHARCR